MSSLDVRKARPRMTLKRTLFALLLFLLTMAGLRLFLVQQMGVSGDEAYYFQWSEQLSVSYPDHPPMTAWLIRLGTVLAGKTALGMRLFSIVLAFAAGWLTYLICIECRFSTNEAVFCAMLENVMLMPAVGGILMTPDVPLAFSWLLTLLFLIRAMKLARVRDIYLLVLPLIAACYSKHAGVLLLGITLVVFVFTPPLRRTLRTIHPWLALLLFFAAMMPWLLAERQHHFWSLLHQSAHASGALLGTHVSFAMFPLRWGELLLGQFALLSPLVCIWCVSYFRTPFKASPFILPLALAFLTPIAVTLVTALFTHPEQNWASLGHPAAAIIAVAALRNRPDDKEKAAWMFGSAMLITLIVHIHAVYPFLPLPADRDPVSRLHGYEQLLKIEDLTHHVDEIICDNYALAAQLHWVLNRPEHQINVVGTNRMFAVPSPGTWLILDEQNDFGNYSPDASCEREVDFAPLHLMQGKKVLHIIQIKKGFHCRTSQSIRSGRK